MIIPLRRKSRIFYFLRKLLRAEKPLFLLPRNGVNGLKVGSICLLFLLACVSVFAEEIKIDLDIIAQIESNNNPLAYNPNSQATGKYQITPICLRDFLNNHNDSQHKLYAFHISNMFQEKYAYLVANWYFNIRIPELLSNFNMPDTLENRLICYNAGIKYVVQQLPLPIETKNYLAKYKKLVASVIR